MFGDLMSQMGEKQEKMQQELAQKEFTTTVGNGAVTVSCNGLRRLTNVSIHPAKLDMEDTEELEDLILTAVNRVLEEATASEAAMMGDLTKDLLPPGFENIFG